eukprot:2960510-Rhodomonas_salina.2
MRKRRKRTERKRERSGTHPTWSSLVAAEVRSVPDIARTARWTSKSNTRTRTSTAICTGVLRL